MTVPHSSHDWWSHIWPQQCWSRLWFSSRSLRPLRWPRWPVRRPQRETDPQPDHTPVVSNLHSATGTSSGLQHSLHQSDLTVSVLGQQLRTSRWALGLLALVALLGGATPAQALQTPATSPLDHRIQHVTYDARNVTRINAANGYITAVIFAPGEHVLNYGSGYSTAWEFATADNKFFLKPKDKEGTTNLVVVTDRRLYNFDVYLVENPRNATYLLTFDYPQEQTKRQEQQLAAQRVQEKLKAPDPNIESNPHLKNCDYTMNFGESEGSKLIAPMQVFDDGLFTYFKFQPNTDFPAIYRVSSDGEAIINSHIEQETLVVHGVYPEYRLRAGSDVVGVYNEHYLTNQGKLSVRHENTLASGTSVRGVNRYIKQ